MSELIDHLWERIDVGEPDECWEWKLSRTSNGYGQVTFKQEHYIVHRTLFILLNGYAPPVVRHSCDNPPCCNPDHLLPGTQADNVRDMHERGRARSRSLHGSENPRAKIDEDQAAEILRLLHLGQNAMQVARTLGVKAGVVHAIRAGAWSHVDRSGLSIPRGVISGETHPSSKITDEQVEEIRRLVGEGTRSQREIALMFGIGQQQVSRIARGQSRGARDSRSMTEVAS